MVSSISSTAEDSIKLMMGQMLQQMNAADTDGISGLSKDELSSINADNDIGGAAFLKSLAEQFDKLDEDGNGQLSANEIASANPLSGPMGPPPGLPIESDDSTEKLTGSVSSTSSNESSAVSSDDAKSLIDKLLKSLIESFTDSFSKDASKNTDDKTQAAKNLVKTADKDGDGSLSKEELSSTNAGSNAEQSKMINNLINSFTSYDKDGNGKLSLSEMREAIPQKQFSMQELAAMSDNYQKADSAGHALGNFSGSMARQFLNSYQNGGLSSLTSSFSLAG